MKRAATSTIRLNDHTPNSQAMLSTYAKRLRLNHNLDQFPLAEHIVKQFLASVNALDVKISWPRDMKDHIENDVDWIMSMLAYMLYMGIVGYRVKYLPFYKAELVCSAYEFGGFVYHDSVFSWRSTAQGLPPDIPLPVYISPGKRPFTYGRESSVEGWLFNGVISHHDFDYNTHNEITDDTLRASNRSSEGTFSRTVKFTPDLPLENVKRSIQQERLNPAFMMTEAGDGYKEDAKSMIAFTQAMVEGVEDPPSDWKASTIPAGVEQQRVAPPRSFIGGMISIEEQILHRMSLLVFKCTPECQRCIERCIQDIYDDFLKPEIFYMQYMLMYQGLRDMLVAAVSGQPISDDKKDPSRQTAEVAARAFMVYRGQIARFASLYEESSAKMVAFFSNLNVEPFVNMIQEVQERYGGSAVQNIARHGAVRLLLQWLRYEVQFCKDRIAEVQAERHPPLTEKEQKKKEKEMAKEPPENEDREARLKREAEERKVQEEEVKAWEEAEKDKVSYSWKIATPDIATQDYGQPSLTREKRDQ